MKKDCWLHAEKQQRATFRKSYLGASGALLGVSLILMVGARPISADESTTSLSENISENFVVENVINSNDSNNTLGNGVHNSKEILQRVSVHDPSIFYDDASATYYVFGSHLAQAKSDDLKNWTPMFNHEYENPSSILGELNKNLAKPFEWAGYDDADTANGGYAIWAPDVIWNPSYKWEDGTTGAYMYYFSNSSTWRRSVISYAVSKDVEGPYDYVDSLVYSGFTKENATDGSNRNTKFTGTNLDELMSSGVIAGGFNDKWNRDNGRTYNNDYAPNAIDANVFFDKDGKLFMSYGSWSGGIFLLELDPSTGKALYPGTDSKTPDGRVIDKYFGTQLVGGWHQSGEAPYIMYDAATDYYYLFVTYGGLGRTGGYNMRLFRSKTVDGLYLDAKGEHPTYTGWTSDPINASYGVKVMGNYDFTSLPSAYMSPGHNSAFIDKNGNWFLVYHTRFNQGTEYHEVRVHPMVMTEEGWPVALPYEYDGDDINLNKSTKEQFTGDYEFVNHGTDTSGQAIAKANISLNEDGSVSGALIGRWSQEYRDGVYHLTITDSEGHVYKGQFARQADETAEHNPKLVFSLVGDNNEVLWGSKPYETLKIGHVKVSFRDADGKRISEDIDLEGAVGDVVSLPAIPEISGYRFKEQVGVAKTFSNDSLVVSYQYEKIAESLPNDSNENQKQAKQEKKRQKKAEKNQTKAIKTQNKGNKKQSKSNKKP